MKITKIVITGGPCAGKTTAMSWVQNAFSSLGYTVLFVPETATELITGGVAPWTTGTNCDYQKGQVRLQLEKESVFLEAAKTMPAEKILIVCDRGCMDNLAYMNQEEFQEVLKYVGKTEKELKERYDAVFHLVTAAKGAEEFYTTSNNAARTETVEQASSLDDKLIACWSGHPHLRVIDNSVEFQLKMKRLVGEIASFLGEKAPFEFERKFLIKYPDTAWLDSLPDSHRIEIVQTHLNSTNNLSSVRLRERGIDGNYVYYQTVRKVIEDGQSVEVEKRLSKEEYLELLWEADARKPQIRKTRYCISYKGLFFEIDLYPYWTEKAVLEVSFNPGRKVLKLPEEIEVIREVTDDPAFSDERLAAHRIPKNR